MDTKKGPKASAGRKSRLLDFRPARHFRAPPLSRDRSLLTGVPGLVHLAEGPRRVVDHGVLGGRHAVDVDQLDVVVRGVHQQLHAAVRVDLRQVAGRGVGSVVVDQEVVHELLHLGALRLQHVLGDGGVSRHLLLSQGLALVHAPPVAHQFEPLEHVLVVVRGGAVGLGRHRLLARRTVHLVEVRELVHPIVEHVRRRIRANDGDLVALRLGITAVREPIRQDRVRASEEHVPVLPQIHGGLVRVRGVHLDGDLAEEDAEIVLRLAGEGDVVGRPTGQLNLTIILRGVPLGSEGLEVAGGIGDPRGVVLPVAGLDVPALEDPTPDGHVEHDVGLAIAGDLDLEVVVGRLAARDVARRREVVVDHPHLRGGDPGPLEDAGAGAGRGRRVLAGTSSAGAARAEEEGGDGACEQAELSFFHDVHLGTGYTATK